MELLTLVIIAGFTEEVLEFLRQLFPKLGDFDKKYKQVGVFIGLGFIIALPFVWGYNADIFAMIENLTGREFTLPYVGLILSAMFASGGTKGIHDLIDWLTSLREEKDE
ncbi:MAG: hypothetical protein ACOCRO_05375 [Halanaerobiales bacterium]